MRSSLIWTPAWAMQPLGQAVRQMQPLGQAVRQVQLLGQAVRRICNKVCKKGARRSKA